MPGGVGAKKTRDSEGWRTWEATAQGEQEAVVKEGNVGIWGPGSDWGW